MSHFELRRARRQYIFGCFSCDFISGDISLDVCIFCPNLCLIYVVFELHSVLPFLSLCLGLINVYLWV